MSCYLTIEPLWEAIADQASGSLMPTSLPYHPASTSLSLSWETSCLTYAHVTSTSPSLDIFELELRDLTYLCSRHLHITQPQRAWAWAWAWIGKCPASTVHIISTYYYFHKLEVSESSNHLSLCQSYISPRLTNESRLVAYTQYTWHNREVNLCKFILFQFEKWNLNFLNHAQSSSLVHYCGSLRLYLPVSQCGYYSSKYT